MAEPPQILSPREPLTDAQGNVTRVWWRFFNSLKSNSGGTADPLVIAPNAVLNEATLTTGGTITLADLPNGTLLGNSSGAAGPAMTQVVADSLSLNNGTLAVADIGPGTLSGNAASASAPPGPITLGTNLSFAGTVLNAASASSPDDETLLYTIRDTRGEIAALQRKVNDLTVLAILYAGAMP